MVWTNTLSYDFNIATEHHINALIGSELSTYDGSNTEGSNTGLIPGFDDWDHAYLVNTNGTENKTVKGSPLRLYPWYVIFRSFGLDMERTLYGECHHACRWLIESLPKVTAGDIFLQYLPDGLSPKRSSWNR